MAKAINTTVSNVLITEDILPAYKDYVEAVAAIDAAKAKRDAAKRRIILFHKDMGVAQIKDKGFSSTLSESKRVTLLKGKIEAKFGKLPEECMRKTVYETVRISSFQNDGYPAHSAWTFWRQGERT